MKQRDPQQQFMANVEPSSDCWLWTGPTEHGHGTFNLGRRTRETDAARVSWLLFRGALGDRDVSQRCLDPLCVRPSHLVLGLEPPVTPSPEQKPLTRSPERLYVPAMTTQTLFASGLGFRKTGAIVGLTLVFGVALLVLEALAGF